ncbi:MAG: sigma factor [Planctomycetota bacterium]
MSEHHDSSDGFDLRRVSTRWSQIENVHGFVLCYVEPIRTYLQRLLDYPDDVDEVLQRLLVRMLESGFGNVDPDRGRFRHYLIRSVRNEVVTWQRERTRRGAVSLESTNALQSVEVTSSDRAFWNQEWRANLIDRAWQALLTQEETQPACFFHSVLKLATDHPKDNSTKLAAAMTLQTRQAMSATAFRKQLSRARRAFAAQIVGDVADTLETGDSRSLRDELKEVGLMPYVEDFIDHLG